MGGGSAMATAAKAAALGGYRTVGSLAGRAAAWRAPKPASAAVSVAAEGGPSITIASTDKSIQDAAPVSAVQRPSWKVDDWEFAGWGEEHAAALDSLHPSPRLVFGPVPTLEEARVATSDLKDAIEKVYLSPSTNEPAIEDYLESTHCETSAIIPSMPRHVVQTFSLLQGSPEVQDVVASLACDENVWDAVMKNEKVIEFYRTHMSIALHPESKVATEVAAADTNCESSVADIDHESSSAEATKSSVFADFVGNAKVKVHKVMVKVVEMVSNTSSFLQGYFETSSETSNSTSTKAGHDTDKSFVDSSLGMSLIALAIAAILVILVKRG